MRALELHHSPPKSAALHDVWPTGGKGPLSWYTRVFDPVVFDPQLLDIVQKAFDAAWAMHTGDFAADGASADTARDLLARSIVEKAQDGERDLEQLKNHGLRQLLRFRNPPPARAGGVA